MPLDNTQDQLKTQVGQLEAELEAVRQELHAALEKQRRGDEVFRRFSDSGLIGIALFELSGRLLFGSEAFLKMIGRSAEELAAGTLRWDELSPPEWRARTAHAVQEVLRRGSSGPDETEYLRADGTRFWGLCTLVATEREQAAAFVLDISERMRLLAREQEARARAEEAQRRLAFLAEATGAVIASLHLDRVLAEILTLSRQLVAADAYAIWRLDPAAGRWSIAAAEGLSPEYQSTAAQALLHSQSAPHDPMIVPDIDQEPMLAQHRHLLRQEGICSMLVSPLQARGTVGGTLVFYYHQPHAFDEIERKVASALANLAASAIATSELYEAANQRAEQLVEADRLKDQFLAMLAHELRNPLGAITNAVHILRRGEERGGAENGTPADRRAREIIDRQSHHMAQLVDQLLDASRVSRGKVEIHPQRLDLARLVHDTFEDHRPTLEAAELSLALELPDQPLWMQGDPTRLRQTVGNLLQNAAKFTPPGGHVTVQAFRRPCVQAFEADEGEAFRRSGVQAFETAKDSSILGHAGPERPNARMPERLTSEHLDAVIVVRDTGIGVPLELLPRLFDPFVQADSSLDRSRGGLGLGLALVKAIVELHGGAATAASDGPGRGATFTLRLPMLDAADAL